MKRGWSGFLCVFALLLSSVLPSPAAPGGNPRLWSIRVQLKLKGGYVYDGADRVLKGEFVYETAWNGVLEKDGEDFILYHGRLEPLAWQIEEKDAAGGDCRPLDETALPKRPEFRMIYLLGEDKLLRIYFTVDGFRVPIRDSVEKFDLVFPASKRESEDDSDYKDSIVKGSNDISFERSGLHRGPLQRSFLWKWKRYFPTTVQGSSLVMSEMHEVEVLIDITPKH